MAPNQSQPRFNMILGAVAFFWSVVIVLFAAWDYRQSSAATFEDARSAATEGYAKDVIYRRWAAMHGGVYAPVTPETPPNPYLSDLPERDITSPSGKKLTLINPAYMTRQVYELAKKETGYRGHLTSLNPLRPENAADEWETSALRAFARGTKEVSSVEPLDGEVHLRFMRPLITERECLQCHAQQGYKLGDIRGGISVSVPWAPYRAALRSQLLAHITGYGGIWAIGILGLGLARKRLRNQLSERELAVKTLQESENRFRQMYEKAPLAYQSLDAAGNILEVNEAWLTLFGRERSEVLGRFIGEFITEASVSTFKASFPKLLCDGRVDGPLFEIVRKLDGEHRVIMVNGSVSRDAEGNFVRTHCILSDITERERYQGELRRLNEKLEQRVEERTRDLQVANHELESFSYSVSHDLRAPLRVIDGCSRALAEDYAALLDATGRDHLRRARAGAARMGNMIDDLLKLSRVSQQELQKATVDLSALAREIAEELRTSEPGRAVDWVIAENARITGDQGLLRIALQNLIGNAWKYSAGRERSCIEFGVSGGGDRKTYFVRDNGAGFDMARADKLFTAFQRLHSAAEFPGTGVGLATVARIIGRHGGVVRAQGNVNEGATFSFTL